MTPAIKLLDKLGVHYRIREYKSDDDSRNYGQSAALALQQDTTQVFKTLVAIVDGNQRKPVVALVSAAHQLDLKKLAAASQGRKAMMAEPAVAQKVTGYVVGGISPLGQRNRLPTLLDNSATNFQTIFISGGKRGLQLELCPKDLAGALDARFTDLRKPG